MAHRRRTASPAFFSRPWTPTGGRLPAPAAVVAAAVVVGIVAVVVVVVVVAVVVVVVVVVVAAVVVIIDIVVVVVWHNLALKAPASKSLLQSTSCFCFAVPLHPHGQQDMRDSATAAAAVIV